MNDTIVSIRVPKSLLKELKQLSETEHFLDVSEEVRSIVRKKWESHVNPEIFQLQKLREDIGTHLHKKGEKRIQEELNKVTEFRVQEHLDIFNFTFNLYSNIVFYKVGFDYFSINTAIAELLLQLVKNIFTPVALNKTAAPIVNSQNLWFTDSGI